MNIIDFPPDNNPIIDQAADLLVAGFKDHWPQAWPNREAALHEVRECLAPGRINRLAVDERGAVLGWIGAIPQYQGHTWELHPLVVQPEQQGQGLGRALVADLEARVRERGGLSIYLGTDDEDNMTSLAGTDLYPNVLDHLLKLRNLGGHPYEFYQKLGYVVVGVIPEANGPGKPDIIMAKRIALL